MKYCFITGTSKGIGKAIAEKFLDNENYFVIGISRTCSITHKNYKHITFDLSNLENLKNSLDDIFLDLDTSEKIVLINNSGLLGQVGYIGSIENNSIESLFTLNTIVPSILMNAFLEKYNKLNCKKIIVNISSGAGRRVIDGWASYCASKSALDMFSNVIFEEQKILKNNVKIYSVAPGVVETQMQEQIRKVDKKDFSSVEQFIKLKEKNILETPENVARKFLYLIENDEKFDKVIFEINEIA